MSEEIINRVAESALKTIDLDDYYDHQATRTDFDFADLLYQGMILREKDFREFVRIHDWNQYVGHHVSVCNSSDAIIPSWAIMVVFTKLQPVALTAIYGNRQELEHQLYRNALAKIDTASFKNAKVVVKGCGKFPVPAFAFAELTYLLTPYIASLMYGEPCSTVPVYKKKN